MRDEQNGRCAICGVIPDERLLVDHDHESGKVRALLCRKCNSAIGYLGDSSAVVGRAFEYLLKWDK